MDATEYQKAAMATAIYPREQEVTYPILGLIGEAGEVAEKWKKHLRDDDPSDEQARRRAEYEVARELGDVCWYVAVLARDLGFDLEEVMSNNLAKLKDRKERGAIKGSGDDR